MAHRVYPDGEQTRSPEYPARREHLLDSEYRAPRTVSRMPTRMQPTRSSRSPGRPGLSWDFIRERHAFDHARCRLCATSPRLFTFSSCADIKKDRWIRRVQKLIDVFSKKETFVINFWQYSLYCNSLPRFNSICSVRLRKNMALSFTTISKRDVGEGHEIIFIHTNGNLEIS